MTITKEQIRAALAKHATLSIECEPEDMPIEGNASAIGPEEDEKTYRWIREQLARGNQWAWCHVMVRAEWCGLVAEDHIGGCSYESEADFKRLDWYYDDMVRVCLDELAARVAEIVHLTEMLVAGAGGAA